ncbi:MAG: DUF5947 family protein [Actinomycetota bacterium]
MSGPAGTSGERLTNGQPARNGSSGGASSIGSYRRAAMISGLRQLVKPPAPDKDEHCELCNLPIPARHRHLLHLDERRIVCVCATCWALRSGDAEFRPAGNRTVWLTDFQLPPELWASFQVPIGLCFFFSSGSVKKVVGLYPSPAGATECELYLDSWEELKELNPVLATIEVDIEALIINRLVDPHQYAIAPIDQAYELVGLIKANWEGISGGAGLSAAVENFFDQLKAADLNL